ncbi:IspD/TarI family cytidylyltransferase [Glycomyces albus]
MPDSTPRPSTLAAVLAGGTGSRMSADLPKQLLEVAGRPLLAHTLAAFEASESVDEVVVVMAESHLEQAHAVAVDAGATKVAAVVPGGVDRSASSRAALAWALERSGPEGRLLIHDAARMLVSPTLIDAVAASLDRHEAASAAVPSTDTVVEVRGEDGAEYFASVPDRESLRRVQTPQGFRIATLAAAFTAAAADPAFRATDDGSVVLRYLPGTPVAVVPGEEHNLKVTEPLDLTVAGAILELRG